MGSRMTRADRKRRLSTTAESCEELAGTCQEAADALAAQGFAGDAGEWRRRAKVWRDTAARMRRGVCR